MKERIAIDWTACKGRGVCSELLPERITLDEWGYPVLDPTPLSPAEYPYARLAVEACPTRALRTQPAAPSRGRLSPATSGSQPLDRSTVDTGPDTHHATGRT